MAELDHYVESPKKAGRFRRASQTTRLHGMLMDQDKMSANWCMGMVFFENDIGIEPVKEMVRDKVLKMPRFRSAYDFKKNGFRELSDEELDINGYHVVAVEETVTMEDIQRDWIGNVYKHFAYDPNKPLWQFTYFSKLDDGRSMLLTNISHVIGDGVSQIEVLLRLMDEEKEDPEAEKKTAAPKRRKKPKGTYGPLNKAKIFMGGVFAALASAAAKPDSPGPLMRKDVTVASVQKKFAMTESIALDKLKDIKQKYKDATLNDIMVALLTLTLKAYLREVEGGEAFLKSKGKVRASFPINTRSKKAKTTFRDGSPNNNIALGMLQFPLKGNSRTKTVYTVKRKLDRIKLSPMPIVQLFLARTLLKLLSRKAATELFQEAGNQTTAMLSNVPGPQHTAYLGGHKVQDLQFGLYSGNGLYLGLISYDGKVSCGICMDDQLGEPNQLAKHWKSEFEALYEETMKHEGMVPQPKSMLSFLNKI
uniref:Diacylglycerol O-acyltransferase n=1 Tax=Aplanochytrium stocchinoi TaxID=215587 RepID=A0A7S3PM23_9STRA|mmetsp:Transcript_4991/g.6493  ORF Transcript_4991/g.6493 Transcript_4991/m.6493 type:complete len:478 (+) Transcript_4991:121-1554(+)